MNMHQNRTPLFDALQTYQDEQIVPLHVPGHKQGRGLPELKEYWGDRVFAFDLSAMDSLDYYNNPTGVIREAEELLAEAFGAERAFFLVNGTTSGVQGMILSACKPGSKLILPRNAHKSIVGGLILSGAFPVYIQPAYHDRLGIAMGVTPERVQAAIEANPDAKAVFVINPTYYGAASDLKAIVKLAHDNGMYALVDEAHGAHMCFHPEFPLSSMAAGADLSAVSLHKTGGSLTQSSALLMGAHMDGGLVKQALELTSTSSASYLLLCSLDMARKQLATRGRELLEETLRLARWAREEINQIEGLYAFGKELTGTPWCFNFDETKLGICVARLGYTGYEMEAKLRREYGIQIEMADLNNILAILSIGDSRETLRSLIGALRDIAGNAKIRDIPSKPILPVPPEIVVAPREAFYAEKKTVRLEKSVGEIAGEIIMAYPPGIPVIGIGERISKEVVNYIKRLKAEHCQLQGAADPRINSIQVLVK